MSLNFKDFFFLIFGLIVILIFVFCKIFSYYNIIQLLYFILYISFSHLYWLFHYSMQSNPIGGLLTLLYSELNTKWHEEDEDHKSQGKWNVVQHRPLSETDEKWATSKYLAQSQYLYIGTSGLQHLCTFSLFNFITKNTTPSKIFLFYHNLLWHFLYHNFNA